MGHKTPLTKEVLKEYITEIFETPREEIREITIGQGCLEQGFVTRSSSNLNLCSNSKCSSCNIIHKLLSEEDDKFLKLDLED